MSTPVTRGELKAELGQFEMRLDQKLDQKLGLWGGALRAQIEGSEQRLLTELARHVEASEQRLLTELARHVGAVQEALSTQVSVLDEKYTDLPARVRRLETTVFRSKRR
jgi:hypothetical protein